MYRDAIKFYAFDRRSYFGQHIADVLRESTPQQAFVLGPGAPLILLEECVDFSKMIPPEYSNALFINEECQLQWLVKTMQNISRNPTMHVLVASNFPSSIRAHSFSASYWNSRGTHQVSVGRNELKPSGVSSCTRFIFWIGLAPIDYLDDICQYYFSDISQPINFHCLVSIREDDALPEEKYVCLRKMSSPSHRSEMLREYSLEIIGGSRFGGILM
jgi:hypothetical protein